VSAEDDPVWISDLMRDVAGMTEPRLLQQHPPPGFIFALYPQHFIWPNNAYFFHIEKGGFELSLRVVGHDQLVLRRNGYEVPPCTLAPPCAVIVAWAPELLAVTTGLPVADVVYDSYRIKTPPTPLPLWVHDYLESKIYAQPQKSYRSKNDFWNEVYDQLAALNRRFRIDGLPPGFFDGDKPQREPLLTQEVLHLLHYVRPLKGLKIRPELTLGDGRLDFEVSGFLDTGEPVAVAVEFKLAHSPDVLHGLFVQLPEYMDRLPTDLGIFVVIDFGLPTPGIVRGEEWGKIPGRDLMTKLAHACVMKGRQIKSVVISATRGSNPSKKARNERKRKAKKT
jgi:hypothetical protein